MKVREAAVAGLFYPGEPEELRGTVAELLKDARERARQLTPLPGQLTAAIVPHAGYIYSGPTAAMIYQLLEPAQDTINHVVIIGPAHRVGINALALPDADAMATPLGDIPLWSHGVDIALAQPDVVVSEAVHAMEHSIEVQLPFLQTVLPQADILPLAAGWIEPHVVANVLDALWEEDGTLILISSDLSHYLPYDKAQRIDQSTINQILNRDHEVRHDRACGATGINAISLTATTHHLSTHLLELCNSGDTAGDRTSVVGYAAVAYCDIDEPEEVVA